MAINFFRNQGLNDDTIAGILGNMQAESTIQPLLTEAGGGGGYRTRSMDTKKFIN